MNQAGISESIIDAAQSQNYGVTINNFDGSYVYANDSFCDICEYSQQELMSMGFKDLTHPDDIQVNVELDRQLSAGTIPFFQLAKRYVTKSGNIKHVLLQVSLLRDAQGQPTHYYAQVVDVTDLSHLLEKKSGLSEAPTPNEAITLSNYSGADSFDIIDIYREQSLNKSKHLGYIVHELKNPLNNLLGMGDLIRDAGKKGKLEMIDECYRHFARSGKILERLINHILELTFIDTGHLTLDRSRFSLTDLTTNVVNSLQSMSNQHQIPVLVEQSDLDDDIIYSDKEKLWGVLVNLISNAIKYTEQGHVEVLLGSAEQDRFFIQVKDTGIGIAATDLEKVFDEYTKVYQNIKKSVDSTGLGLPITKRLVNSLGGSIEVQSELKVGSTFTVTLPRAL